ncbi:MAG: F0F1 ATP synthase subunit A [Ignavibacteria bacterium]|jgi:ATP synthase subunit 6|nr:F0F1 ATP synthase subunit A [Ignavibacteria bacterium]
MNNIYQNLDALSLLKVVNNEEASGAGAATNESGSGDVFGEVFANLGDHHGFYVGPIHVCDLPYILEDDGEWHFYANEETLEAGGLYKEVGHKVVRVSDGEAPALDLSITNLVMFQWIAMIICFVVFRIISRKSVLKPNKAPHGLLANAVEKMVLYIRDEVVVSNFSSRKIADSMTFYFVATFTFILVNNLVGLLPGAHTATGAIPVTAALAIVAFFVINGAAIRYSGVGHWFKHMLGGAPIFLSPIMIPIEILSLFIKPFSLTIRLFANMTAGHIVLFSLLGLLFFFGTYVLAIAIVPFSVFIYLLELLVAFIQAFVFTMLVSIYTSQSIGEVHEH